MTRSLFRTRPAPDMPIFWYQLIDHSSLISILKFNVPIYSDLPRCLSIRTSVFKIGLRSMAVIPLKLCGIRLILWSAFNHVEQKTEGELFKNGTGPILTKSMKVRLAICKPLLWTLVVLSMFSFCYTYTGQWTKVFQLQRTIQKASMCRFSVN